MRNQFLNDLACFLAGCAVGMSILSILGLLRGAL